MTLQLSPNKQSQFSRKCSNYEDHLCFSQKLSNSLNLPCFILFICLCTLIDISVNAPVLASQLIFNCSRLARCFDKVVKIPFPFPISSHSFFFPIDTCYAAPSSQLRPQNPLCLRLRQDRVSNTVDHETRPPRSDTKTSPQHCEDTHVSVHFCLPLPPQSLLLFFFQSLSFASCDPPDVPHGPVVRSQRSFNTVTDCLSKMRDDMKMLLNDRWPVISDAGT